MPPYEAVSLPRRYIPVLFNDTRRVSLGESSGVVTVTPVAQVGDELHKRTVLRGRTIADMPVLLKRKDQLEEERNKALQILGAAVLYGALSKALVGPPLQRRPGVNDPPPMLSDEQMKYLRTGEGVRPGPNPPLRPNPPGIAATVVGSLVGLGTGGAYIHFLDTQGLVNEQELQIRDLERAIKASPALSGAWTVEEADQLDMIDFARTEKETTTTAVIVKMPPMWSRDP